MFSLLRNRFGIPGVISVIALVFAMFGGAYAASNSGGGKATASAKGKQGPRGKTGKTGPAGPAGPAGANGKDGANGSNGSNGQDGAAGGPGAPGTSVTNTKLNAGNVKCPEGGAEFKVGTGTATVACNGEPGAEGDPGPEGSPWTAGGTLPPGATETGAWAFSATDAEAEIWVPISFAIPLATNELTEEHVHYQTDSDFSAKCPLPGNVSTPMAPPGELCVYASAVESPVSGKPVNAAFQQISQLGFNFKEASSSGAVLHFEFTGAPATLAHGSGSWAVTGCSESLPVGNPNKCPL